jgi:formylglycine-generating enzyme required for sulfatase activity
MVAAQSADRPAPCPRAMVHVEGEHCPKVEQRCLRWMDPPTSRYADFRCAQYEEPAACASPRTHMDYCIDRDEVAVDGSDLPTNEQSWTDADRYCRAAGKRVCMQSEWQFACEGVEMRPYPYGSRRDPSACNADRVDIYEAGGARIRDLRARHGAYPRCTSPFGVRDLTGNLEEVVTIDGTSPPRAALMGAWWQPGRNHCRARQTAHDTHYRGRETGFRCCADVR